MTLRSYVVNVTEVYVYTQIRYNITVNRYTEQYLFDI